MTEITQQDLNQTTFNRMVKGVFEQGATAVTTNRFNLRTCQYRTNEGLKCAVGQLIKDEDYGPHMEDEPSDTVYNVAEQYNIPSELLFATQEAHDDAVDLDDFFARASQVARDFNLEMPYIEGYSKIEA